MKGCKCKVFPLCTCTCLIVQTKAPANGFTAIWLQSYWLRLTDWCKEFMHCNITTSWRAWTGLNLVAQHAKLSQIQNVNMEKILEQTGAVCVRYLDLCWLLTHLCVHKNFATDQFLETAKSHNISSCVDAVQNHAHIKEVGQNINDAFHLTGLRNHDRVE